MRPFREQHRERRSAAHQPDRLLHAGVARTPAAAPRTHLRGALARARPSDRAVRVDAGRAALVDRDHRRQDLRLPPRRFGRRCGARRRGDLRAGRRLGRIDRWLAPSCSACCSSSLSLGMVLAIISKTESQAVQFAMLALLAGLFFSGFILPIDRTELSRQDRSRGCSRSPTASTGSSRSCSPELLLPRSTVYGLGALVVGYGVLAIAGLTRQLGSKGGS